MSIVAEYDSATVHPNGCGGVEASGRMFINSGGGTPANPLESDLYSFPLARFSLTPNPPNTPAPTVVFSHDSRGFVDDSGATLPPYGGYLWVADRAAHRVIVVQVARNLVVHEFSLARQRKPGAGSHGPVAVERECLRLAAGAEPAYRQCARGEQRGGDYSGARRHSHGGAGGALVAVAPISRVVDGVERADPHGLRVRRT